MTTLDIFNVTTRIVEVPEGDIEESIKISKDHMEDEMEALDIDVEDREDSKESTLKDSSYDSDDNDKDEDVESDDEVEASENYVSDRDESEEAALKDSSDDDYYD